MEENLRNEQLNLLQNLLIQMEHELPQMDVMQPLTESDLRKIKLEKYKAPKPKKGENPYLSE